MLAPLSGLVLVFLAAQDPAGEPERVRALSGEGRYAEALELAANIEPPAERDRLRAEVLYAAHDFGGALAASRAARSLRPDDLALAWREASCLLWLRDGEGALVVLVELERALERAELGAEDRRAWRDVLEDFRGRAAALVQANEALAGAVGRARLFSLAGLGAALVGMVVLARRA